MNDDELEFEEGVDRAAQTGVHTARECRCFREALSAWHAAAIALGCEDEFKNVQRAVRSESRTFLSEPKRQGDGA